jgi:hypothetical protein
LTATTPKELFAPVTVVVPAVVVRLAAPERSLIAPPDDEIAPVSVPFLIVPPASVTSYDGIWVTTT